MKRIVFAICMLLSPVTIAEEQPTKLDELSKVVNVGDAANKAAQSATKPIEVADKALDMVKGAVSSVSETVQKAAPHVWKIMVKQQYIKAATTVMLPWMLFGLVFGYYFYVKKVWVWDPKSHTNTEEAIVGRAILVKIVPGVLWIIFGCWGSWALSESLAYILNPEYYAIRDMLLMALRPSAAGS